MTTQRLHRSYDYVNQPFARVLAALREDAPGIVARATHGAAERERTLSAQLRLRVAGVDVSTDVRVELAPVQEDSGASAGHASATFPLSWSAVASPSLFPRMRGYLRIYPLSSHETQVEFEGSYVPPLGVVGDAIDAVVGHRIAEACVLHLVQDVAAQLRGEVSKRG